MTLSNSPPPDGSFDPGVVFLFGVTQRSGTNLLSDLMVAHPSCVRPESLHEDGLTRPSGHLVSYAGAVTRTWNRWRRDPIEPSTILETMGSALLALVRQDVPAGDVVVLKSPFVDDLENFARLFPRARAVLLVRDGRAVMESFDKSWGAMRSRTIVRWRDGIRSIRSVVEGDLQDQFLLIRYEDLVTHRERTLRSVFDFIGVPVDDYDYATADNAPIRGSSVVRGDDDDLTWEPREVTEAFDPLGRFSGWTASERGEFSDVAGAELTWAGYDTDPVRRRDRVRGFGLRAEATIVDAIKSRAPRLARWAVARRSR